MLYRDRARVPYAPGRSVSIKGSGRSGKGSTENRKNRKNSENNFLKIPIAKSPYRFNITLKRFWAKMCSGRYPTRAVFLLNIKIGKKSKSRKFEEIGKNRKIISSKFPSPKALYYRFNITLQRFWAKKCSGRVPPYARFFLGRRHKNRKKAESPRRSRPRDWSLQTRSRTSRSSRPWSGGSVLPPLMVWSNSLRDGTRAPSGRRCKS